MRRFAIVGAARNCGPFIEADVARIEAALAPFGSTSWFVVESDSRDETVACLQRLRTTRDNFGYVSLGDLIETLPKRTERLALCRNRYLEEIERVAALDSATHVVVVDLDGINAEITSDAVATCWAREDWDVVAACQTGPYYDLWALRHPLWCASDWRKYKTYLESVGYSEMKAMDLALAGKEITIRGRNTWIAVSSAFGGMAIYRRGVLRGRRYNGLHDDGDQICEHVPLHLAMVDGGAKIFINPLLVNAHYTEHTWRRSFWGRVAIVLKVPFFEFYMEEYTYVKRPWFRRVTRMFGAKDTPLT